MDDGYGSVTIIHDERSPEDVFQDFRRRRAGIVKALTSDVEKFYKLCDPVKENLCLYDLPNETWEVTLPADEVPPELPEPALGINFARDGMHEKDWLSLVAVHSDSWLLSVAFFFGARFGFDKEARRQLFMMMNGLPTVFEVVSGGVKKQSKTANGSSKNKSGSSHQRSPVLIASQQSRSSQSTQKTTVIEEMEVMMIKLKPFVVPVMRLTQMASSGFAVTFVRPGSMANVSRSPLPRQSTSTITSVLAAATRGAENERQVLLSNVMGIIVVIAQQKR